MADKPSTAEMTPGPGFRVKSGYPRLPEKIVRGFADFESPDISDSLNSLYTMSSDLLNLVNEQPLVGRACTVKVYPGDNLMVHKALDIAQPGDIVVVDAGGHSGTAVLGDLIARKAAHLGIAGFVVDGFIRDLPGLLEVDMPVYARGVTPVGPLHRGPGEVNFAISCGGIVVNPGDIIAADRNGIVVVHNEFAEQTLARLLARRESMSAYVESVKVGEFSNAWVDRALSDSDCESID